MAASFRYLPATTTHRAIRLVPTQFVLPRRNAATTTRGSSAARGQRDHDWPVLAAQSALKRRRGDAA